MFKKIFFLNIIILTLTSFVYEYNLTLALIFTAIILSPSLIVANYSSLISGKIIVNFLYIVLLNGLFFNYINYHKNDNYIYFSINSFDYFKVIIPASLILISFVTLLIFWQNIYKSLYLKFFKYSPQKKTLYFPI